MTKLREARAWDAGSEQRGTRSLPVRSASASSTGGFSPLVLAGGVCELTRGAPLLEYHQDRFRSVPRRAVPQKKYRNGDECVTEVPGTLAVVA